MSRHCRRVLRTDMSGLEMKRYESDLVNRCTVEYMWMGRIVGPLAGPSVIISSPVLVQY
jgi:hypothetical protein